MSIRNLFIAFLLILCAAPGFCQETYEYFPHEAIYLPQEIRSWTDVTIKLAPGVYELENQFYFKDGSNLIIEGSGSGLGEDATILDFTVYSANEEDSRALSVRDKVTIRNLTVRNVGGRAADLRTGTIDSPSDKPVVFENVWFVNCNTGPKSTGGRTVGSAEVPMQIRHCVFLNTPDYPFPNMDSFLDFRDTTYVDIDHCDFFNTDDIIQIRVNDPEAAPNGGPVVNITNSILYSLNGPDDDDMDVSAGKLTYQNCVFWDAVSQAGLDRLGGGEIVEIDSVIGDPLYVHVAAGVPGDELDFNLQPGSPASGLGTDGLNAGSIAAEPVAVESWEIY